MTILSFRNKPREVFLLELEKCDVLCSRCHNEQLYLNRPNEYATSYYTKLRKELDELKKQFACKVCGDGGEELHYDLDFHHRDPEEKEFDLTILSFKRTREVFLRELEKCDPLCSRCHKELHHFKRQKN